MPPDMPPRNWNIKVVKAPEALASLGTGQVWGDVKVAHIDMGVTRHPAIGDWVKIEDGVNYLETGALPIDPLKSAFKVLGHGTKTCSVLCGRDDANGFVGAAPGLPTIPYRVMNHVAILWEFQSLNIAKAIRHAIEVRGCRVITISLGTPKLPLGDAELGHAIDEAYERGVIVVAAGGQKISVPCYPGKFFRTISAGGFVGGPDGQPARMYQNYGTMNGWMDVWGPAKPIFRALGWKKNADQSAPYQLNGDGTSNATPLVAAAAAMWLVKHGGALESTYGAELWQRVEAFRACLKLSARDLSNLPDFAGIKPPKTIGEIQPKGSDSTVARTGGLDILALLGIETLPAPKDLKQSAPAAGQRG